MKLILYSWGAFNEKILENELIRQGHNVVVANYPCNHYTRDFELAQNLINMIHKEGCDGIISFNYFPIISMVADVTGVIYYSWIYDSPHSTLYAKSAVLPCNRIGVFDSCMVNELREMGVSGAFYQPLASNWEYFEKTINGSGDIKKYNTEVSFVGKLYTGEHNYFDMIYENPVFEDVDFVMRGCVFNDEYVNELRKLWDTKNGYAFAKERMEEMGFMLGPDYFESADKVIFDNVYSKKITVEERRVLFERISSVKDIDFLLYTSSDTNIKHKSPIDYESVMPLVFNQSKININLTLRSIRSGIPLRILDILSCHGFCLTNPQSDLLEWFEDGKDMAFYSNPEECIEKIHFYLLNEGLRQKIALSGFEKAKKVFTYEALLKKLLNA